jgi:DNA-directed RNA polymerase subunit RPC12/RpoP
MGMYDSVMVPCPKCGEKSEFQSKSGPCDLTVTDLENTPWNVLLDVNRHAPNECMNCQTKFAVKLKVTGTAVVVP